jgi:hypothetical protein
MDGSQNAKAGNLKVINLKISNLSSLHVEFHAVVKTVADPLLCSGEAGYCNDDEAQGRPLLSFTFIKETVS